MTLKNKKRIKHLKIYFWLILILVIPFSNGCTVFQYQLRPPIVRPQSIETLRVTAYCACEQCCGWKRNWIGQKIYAYGPHEGKPKTVGLTASGSKARRGTIAADTNIFPMGTIMYIEGYGYGKVEDRGSAIKGMHIDIFFKSHDEAKEWGNKTMKVKVWLPR